MEYNTKEFANELNCSVRTLEDWRSKRSMKLLPARYDGRKAIYTSEQIPIARKLLCREGLSNNLFPDLDREETAADAPSSPPDICPEGSCIDSCKDTAEQAAPMGDALANEFDSNGDSSGDSEYTADETPQNSRATFDTPEHAEDNHFGELILELPAVESLRAADSDDDSAGKTAPNKAPQRFSEKSAFDPEGFSAITQNAPEKIAPDVHADFVQQAPNEQGEIGGTYFNATGAEKNNAVVDELNHADSTTQEKTPPIDDTSTALIIAQNKMPTRIEDVAKFALIGRDRLRAVYAEISALDKIGVVEEVRKQKLEEGQRIGELVLLAEARLGELLNQMPKATTNHKRHKLEIPSAGKFLNDESESVEIPSAENHSGTKKPSKLEAAAELGFCKNQVSQFQKLADNPAAVQKAIEDAKTRGEIVTRSRALNEIKQAARKGKENRQEERRAENTEKIEKLATPLDAQGLFQTIVIDPPWDWGDEGDVNQFGRAKPEYSTMPFDEIKNLPVNKIADVNCHLYLWVTNRSLPKAFALIEAWGFRYITCLTWCKPSIGMGNYFRGSTEQVLFAVKGSQPLKRHDVGTYFTAPRGEGHSAKPDEFYRLVESCSYAPFIDIFGRKARDGWSVWGENGGDKKIMLANGAGGKEQ